MNQGEGRELPNAHADRLRVRVSKKATCLEETKTDKACKGAESMREIERL